MNPIVTYLVSLAVIIGLEVLIYVLTPTVWDGLVGGYGAGAALLLFTIDLLLARGTSERLSNLPKRQARAGSDQTNEADR